MVLLIRVMIPELVNTPTLLAAVELPQPVKVLPSTVMLPEEVTAFRTAVNVEPFTLPLTVVLAVEAEIPTGEVLLPVKAEPVTVRLPLATIPVPEASIEKVPLVTTRLAAADEIPRLTLPVTLKITLSTVTRFAAPVVLI